MRRLRLMLLFVAVCATGAAWAGSDALMRFAGNIHQFNELFPQEKVYLQFDNTAYFQGDDIWFKAFVVKSSGFSKTESAVLYVDLLSPDGVLLQQQKLKIADGQADGRIQLLDYSTEQARELRGMRPYPSGYYEIRAYTQYMLNFDQDIIFSRVLPVYRTPATEGDYSNPVITLDSSIYSKNRPELEKLRRVNVSFYPEGGHLVQGLPCRVAFKAIDGNGSGINGKLVIKAQDGSRIVAESGHEGMGSFTITPGKNRPDAVFEYEGKRYSFTLPSAQSSGYSMMADMAARKNSLKLAVNRSQSRKEETIGVTVTCRGELVMFEELNMKGMENQFSFDTEMWPAGVCRIVLFTDKGEVLAARSVYNGNLKYVPPVIDVKTDRQRYDAFGKMHLSFQLKGKDGKPLRDRFCVSVRDAGDYGTRYADNLLTDFLLTSDLKGFIHDPSYYFESSDKQHLRNLDLLCMIQGWERYDWEYMTDNKVFKETRRMENCLTLNGEIMTNRILRDRAMDDVKVLVAISPRETDGVEFGQAVTDRNGYFGFDITDFYGKADLTMRLTMADDGRDEPQAKIRLERVRTPAVRAYCRQELLPGWSVKKKERIAADNDYPTVIKESEGIMLPTVSIDGERRYVDYFTFQAYDVEKDVNVEMDMGKHSTDVTGYLIYKGYSVWQPIDRSASWVRVNDGYLNQLDYDYESRSRVLSGPVADEFSYSYNYPFSSYVYSTGGDFQDVSIQPNAQIPENNYFQINGHPVICYVHDNRRFYTSGTYSQPWNIDTQDIESILIFDDLHSTSEVGDYAPDYYSFLKSNRAVPTLIANSYGKFSDRMVLMDIKLKDNHQMTNNSDRSNLGKRVTTLEGYTRSHTFYAPEYPDGAVQGDVDYRRTLYWNPNVVTDENGHAEIEFYNNSYSTKFNVSGAGITTSGMPYVLDKDF